MSEKTDYEKYCKKDLNCKIEDRKKAVAWFKREFPTIFAHINDLALFGADSKNVFPIIKNELVKFREMFKDD